MSEYIQGLTRAGAAWTPKFVTAIDQKVCIGCGRCFKVCSHDVLGMIGITEDGDVVDAFDDEAETKVMALASQGNCIGCEACSKVCGKSAFSHAPLAA
jgi:Nif-specific ferredoxin III